MSYLIKAFKKIAGILRSTAVDDTDQNIISYSILKNKLLSYYKKNEIKVIYDIGAHKGHWAAKIQKMMPSARIVLFEANPDHRKILESRGFESFIGVLSKPGMSECEFFTTETSAPGSTGASYYREVTPIFENVNSRTLKATPLDVIVATNKLPQPDLIKIDTQGSELDIIEGGLSVFRDAKLVLMELPIIEYNQSAPNIHEYLSKMSDLGFLPIELSEVHKFGSTIIQIDLLFANKKIIDENEWKSLKIK